MAYGMPARTKWPARPDTLDFGRRGSGKNRFEVSHMHMETSHRSIVTTYDSTTEELIEMSSQRLAPTTLPAPYR